MAGFSAKSPVDEETLVCIINTCTVTQKAEQKARRIIRLMLKKYPNAAIIVTGCYAQLSKDEIKSFSPRIDVLPGQIKSRISKVPEYLKNQTDFNACLFVKQLEAFFDLPQQKPGFPENSFELSTSSFLAHSRASLKIQDGCNNFCTYCIIPKLRGNYRSVPMERLIKEAEDLAEQGVKELILVAQETTVYGQDIYGEKSLHKLLKELCKISGIRWIRILYCYPEEITDELIETIKTEPKVCHYLDMPIQHASDNVLRRMGRRTNYDFLVKLINHIREEIPDICLRTTLISGFPGETEADHELLMDFVNEMEFDRLGVFTYSREEGTAAYDFADQVEQEIKELRRDELMELQQEIVFSLAEDMIGKTLTVFVEGKVIDENAYISRTYKDAPDVDGYLFIQTSRELMTGDFVRVRVTQANEYDLIGELIDESAQ